MIRERAALICELYRKELRAYFDTPSAYVLSVVLLLINGYLFTATLFLQGQASLGEFFGSMPLLLLFFIPAVTMRLYAEEYRSGTLELLATLPVRDEDVLAAKYLASLSVAFFLLLGTTPYLLTLLLLGRPDLGASLCGYLGLFLDAAVLAAIGLWASGLTRTQSVAFILAFLAGFVLYLLGKIDVLLPGPVARAAGALGMDAHLEALSRGVLDVSDLLYFASLSLFFLYASYLQAHLRRVKG